jgi:DNA adenine methylase
MGAYFGSKATSGLCQPIIALMPPHDTYIESHLGGGAIMQRKPPALRNIGIDLNRRALGKFRCDYPVELVQACAHRFLADFKSALYDEWLSGWETLELQVMNQGGVRTEKVWFNFRLARVHWARYTGKNHTDRQRIKRKAETWGRRYRALPAGERLAVLRP